MRWVLALLVVTGLVVTAVAVVTGAAAQRAAGDPRNPGRTGSGVLGALLAQEGVDVRTVRRSADAIRATDAQTTLVVVDGDRLGADVARRLVATPAARLVLLRPNTPTLTAFDVRARAASPVDATLPPGCATAGPARAGTVAFADMRATYVPTGPADVACYPAGDGFGYVVATTAGGRRVDLVAGGLSNDAVGGEGNASFGLSVLGSQPKVVWLMSTDEARADRPADEAPTLLPAWWELAAVQAALGLVLVGVWRGRRLGPILTERLPVRVRASETVEGHGLLYQRLDARDRAAEALRAGTRDRLGRAFGHTDDPVALSAALAARTGQDPVLVRDLIAGSAPDTDDGLVALASHLDRLEQEARRL